MTHGGWRSGISRRRFLQTLGLGAAALGAGTAGLDDLLRPGGAAAAAAGPDTLVVAQDTSVQTLDPNIVYDNTVRITRGIYESLVTLRGATAQIVPRLATSWQSTPDAKVWTFKLRSGVKFHDGTAFTSAAVKSTVERLIKINRGMGYAYKGVVDTIDTPDPLTVKFNLTGPDAAFAAKLAAVSGALMVSPAAIAAHTSGTDMGQGWLATNAAGTGPYVLESYDKGAGQVVLSAFPGYWGGWQGQHVKRIIFKITPEASTQRLMLEQADADVLTIVAPDLIDALSKENGIKVASFPTQRIFYIAMHCQRPPLNDVKIRQAISYAFDYNGARDLIFNGKLDPLYGPLPNTDPAHLFAEDKPYHLDMAKAKQLLSESSHPTGGFTLSLLVFQGDPTYQKVAQIIQAQLKPLNITVTIQEMQSSVLLDKAGKPETAPDLLPIRNYPDYADPSSMLDATFGKDAWGTAGWNFSFYANDKVEALMKQANQITNQPKRIQLYKDAQKVIVNEAAAIFIGTLINRVPMRSNVQGYSFNPYLGNTFDLYAISKS
ncbi:MAG TPA: ABC transporter substrate-binding protein [bacterium]|nr:ABC transporter substrate-binding protein [bacterium]